MTAKPINLDALEKRARLILDEYQTDAAGEDEPGDYTRDIMLSLAENVISLVAELRIRALGAHQ